MRLSTVTPIVFGLLIGGYLLPAYAQAEELECLTKLHGGITKWNSRWQEDKADNKQHYQVTGIDDFSESDSPYIGLELSALEKAKVSVRYLTISKAKFAKSICEQTLTLSKVGNKAFVQALKSKVQKAPNEPRAQENTLRPLSRQIHFAQPASRNGNRSSERPFIRYTTSGWIRADATAFQKLAICKVLGREYSCLKEEKRHYGQTLDSVGAELLTQMD